MLYWRLRPAALLMFALTAPVAAQQSPQRNAATWYRRAFEQFDKLPQAQRDLLQNYDPSSGAPTPEVRAALSQVQGMLQHMQRGSTQEFSDFNLDFNQGFFLAAPHLNQLRQIAKIARTDALVRLHDGDTSGAAQRIASLYKVGGHGGDDRTIISSLVGQAIFNEADRAAQFGIDSAIFTSTDSATLLNAAKALGTNDPFNSVEALAGEHEFTVDWIANTFLGEDAAAQFAEQMTNFNDTHSVWLKIAALDQDQFASALDEHSALLNRVVEIFMMPDDEAAKAEIAKLDEKFQRKEMGLISHAISPAFSKFLERKLEAEKQLADRIALYEKLATDQAKPQEIANAAVWYLRGIELLEKIETAKLDLIRKAARENALQSSAELAAALAEAQPAIDLFREASQIKRCDFAFARRTGETSKVIPPYAPGMHDGFLALHADALRLMSQDKRDAAVDRITIAFRAGAHLGSDPIIVSALVAHKQFNASLKLIDAAIANGKITPQDEASILNAVERVSRKDPFGYIGALSAARKSIADLLGGLYMRNQADADRRAKARDVAQAFGPDQAFHVLTVYQLLADNSSTPPAAGMSAKTRASRINEILSIDAIEAVATSLPELGPALAAHDWTVFTDNPAPHLTAGGTLADHMRRARGDVRRALVLLKPVDEIAAEQGVSTESEPNG